MRIESRLSRLEKQISSDYADVIELIGQGKYYDELTPEQKIRYIGYSTPFTDIRSYEDFQTFLYASDTPAEKILHFRLEKRTPLSKTVSDEVRAEVEAMLKEVEEEYYSPEAIAERECRYEEIRRIGELRKVAYSRGESMAAYPLPWEK